MTKSKWLQKNQSPTHGTIIDTATSHTPRTDAGEEDEFQPWGHASSVATRHLIKQIEGDSEAKPTPSKESKSTALQRGFEQREAKMRVEVSHQREEEYCKAFLQCCLQCGLAADDTHAFFGAWQTQIEASRQLERDMDRLFGGTSD